MGKYEYLETIGNDLMEKINHAVKMANNNDDMDLLADVVSRILGQIPTTLMTVDWIDRATVQSNADEPLSKEKLDKVMQTICDCNYCKANDDDVVVDIMEAIDQVEAIEK